MATGTVTASVIAAANPMVAALRRSGVFGMDDSRLVIYME
jgi:hypothetical protein